MIMNWKLTALNIRMRREDLKMKQEQVALQLGIDVSTYCRYESAEIHPDADRLEQISVVLRKPLTELMVFDLPPLIMHDNQVAHAYTAGDVHHVHEPETTTAKELVGEVKRLVTIVQRQADQQTKLIDLLLKKRA